MIKKSKTNTRKPTPTEEPVRPPASLRFTPTAWAKLLYLRDYGETEVGGFGIASQHDLLLIEDMQLINQVCTWSHVAFDDDSVANFFDDQVDQGRQPDQFGRVWIHTHPGSCPRPSTTDEETFASAFGRSDWALMFILARGGQSYARLRFNIGPGAEVVLPIEIDYSQPFEGCDFEQWEGEYLTRVRCQQHQRNSPVSEPRSHTVSEQELFEEWYESWLEYAESSERKESVII